MASDTYLSLLPSLLILILLNTIATVADNFSNPVAIYYSVSQFLSLCPF